MKDSNSGSSPDRLTEVLAATWKATFISSHHTLSFLPASSPMRTDETDLGTQV